MNYTCIHNYMVSPLLKQRQGHSYHQHTLNFLLSIMEQRHKENTRAETEDLNNNSNW